MFSGSQCSHTTTHHAGLVHNQDLCKLLINILPAVLQLVHLAPLHGLICKEDTDSYLVSGGENLQKVGRGGQHEHDYVDVAFAWLVVGLGKNMSLMSETMSIVVSVLGNKKVSTDQQVITGEIGGNTQA